MLGQSGVAAVEDYCGVLLNEGRFVAKSITEDRELLSGFSLRHQIFAESLRWAPTRPDGLEYDAYDAEAVHFGVFEEDEILAYLRLIRPGKPFMMEREFIGLVGNGHMIRKQRDTCEMSRLCLSPYAQSLMRAENFGHDSIQMVLHKCVYHWCNSNDIRFLYLVVEKRVYRMMRICGFICRPIGSPVVMPDGVEAIAAILDLREFDQVNEARNSSMYQWFTQFQSVPNILPGRQPEIDLQH